MALMILAASCSTNKQVTSSSKTVDSTVLNEKDSMIRVLEQENQRLTSEIHELQYAGVTFDSSLCPPSVINVPEDCNVDSILALLSYEKNRVKIYADGTIEAEGKLRSAYYSKDKLSRFIVELQRINDSLRQVKQKTETRYVTNTVTVEKKVKRKFFNSPFLWLVIGLVGGYTVRSRFGKILGTI